MVEGAVGTVWPPAAAPRKDRFFIRRHRIINPRFDRPASVASDERVRRGTHVMVGCAVQRHTPNPSDRLDFTRSSSGRDKVTRDRTGVGPGRKRTQIQIRIRKIYEQLW